MEGSTILTSPTLWEITATLLRTSRALEAQLESVLRPLDAGFTDLRLMAIVFVLKGPSQKLLAQRAGLSETIVSVRLARLERLGWVTRTHRGHRLVAVELTAEGVHRLRRLMEAVDQSAPMTVLSGMDPRERQSVLDSLRTVVARLAGETRSAGDEGEDSAARDPVYRVAEELAYLSEAFIALRGGAGEAAAED